MYKRKTFFALAYSPFFSFIPLALISSLWTKDWISFISLSINLFIFVWVILQLREWGGGRRRRRCAQGASLVLEEFNLSLDISWRRERERNSLGSFIIKKALEDHFWDHCSLCVGVAVCLGRSLKKNEKYSEEQNNQNYQKKVARGGEQGKENWKPRQLGPTNTKRNHTKEKKTKEEKATTKRRLSDFCCHQKKKRGVIFWIAF